MASSGKGLFSKWLPVIAIIAVGYLAYQCRDTFEEDSVKGKAVVVTGASTGIGEQLAYHYARLGARVLVTARREHRLKQVGRSQIEIGGQMLQALWHLSPPQESFCVKVTERCRELGGAKGEYYYHVADMGNMNATQGLIERAEQLFGGIDYLVLNHIIVIPLREWRGSDTDFDTMNKIFDVNFRAYVHLASHAMPALERSNGSIVVMSSVAGRVPQPYVIAYSASKFALDGFFGGLRQELSLRNSQVSLTFCIIGFVGTDNAVTQLQKFGVQYLLDLIPAADPGDTALAVIKGAATRRQEVYFPYLEARITTWMRHFAPDLLAAFNRYLYTRPQAGTTG